MSAALAETLTRRFPGLLHPGIAWLTAAVSLAALPHLLRTPPWIPALYFALIILRLGTRSRRPGLHAAFRLGVGIGIVAGVLFSYGTLTGRDAGVALLILLAAMKLLEMAGPRDFYIAAFIGLFLMLTNFFYSQTLPMGAYTALCVGMFVMAFVSYNDTRGAVERRARLRLSGFLLLQALPLAVVLFILFPRIPGPLWGLPKDARGAQTGLDDQMIPGAISELSLSDEVAFRVEFRGEPPPRSAWYWRGPVLWYTDGVKWVPDGRRALQPRIERRGNPVRYVITLEPTERNWLFALEMPAEPPEDSRFSHDMLLRHRGNIINRLRYELVSYPEYTLGAAGYEALIRAQQLPAGRHPRTVELARRWRAEGLDDAEIVDRALRMFNEQEFYYTLQPPLLLEDAIDQFLFETRRGFCEHYAAAFTVLMRAAGIPARIVTGYQGGTLNPVGGYVIVRQRDAHAWTEVWLGEKGWVRVDPTAAVAPNRILGGIETALPDRVSDVPFVLSGNPVARDFWERLGYTWDAVNNRWNQWVLGYDRKRQSLVLSRLGLSWLDDDAMLATTGVVLIGLLLLAAAWLYREVRRETDEARRLYDRFCEVVAGAGIERRPAEGPSDFAVRARRRLPRLGNAIDEITELYISVRYGGAPEQLPALRRSVQNFRGRA